MFNFEGFNTCMTLKKHFFFFILFFQLLLSYAQISESKTFTLSWNDEKLVHLNKETSLILPIVDGNFVDENNIPHSSHLFNVQNNTIVQEYKIKNVKFSDLSSSESKNIQLNKIPTKIQSEFQTSKIKNNSVAILDLIPLVNENGRLKKIISFTLDYTLITNNSSEIKNKSGVLYIDRSVLSNGSWYKFKVDTTGFFKIDKDLLQQIGISTSNLNPKNLRIYGNGGKMLAQLNSDFRYDDLKENAIHVAGEEDGIFDDSDYILFYAQGPHHWNINQDQFKFSKHTTNIYSDFAYYFITADNGPGKRVTTSSPINEPANSQINSYHKFDFHERENVNLFANGQQWLGEDFSSAESQNFIFDFKDLDASEDVSIRVRGVAFSSSDTKMTILVNGKELMDLYYPSIPRNSLRKASSDEKARTVLLNNEQIDVQIIYNNAGNPSSRGYLDFIEVIGNCELVARGSQFSFQNTDANDPGSIYSYTISNADNVKELWDISDPINPKKILNTSDTNDFVYRAEGGNKTYAVQGTESYFVPETIEENEVPNQNLHGLKDIDYVIISQDYLFSEAERLADYHRENSGLTVSVINLEEIYNEFGSGSPDLTAIRDFIRFLYLNATNEESRVRYVCLFGDASFDFKDRISGNNNVIPAFQSYESFNLATGYVTDDYFGMMDGNEGNLGSADLQDVATGRYPVTSLKEARETIDKTLNYYANSSLGNWRNTLTFVADDPDNDEEFILQKGLDLITEEIDEKKPAFNIKKIYADAYQQESSAGGELYPAVNEAINNAVETGTLFLDYFGHGGVNGWAAERILEIPQIQNWNNVNNLPLFITVTCEFTRFDNPSRLSAGEYTMWNARGGTSHLISTTREIFIREGNDFNRNLILNLLSAEEEDYSISEVLMYTKHQSFSSQRFFVYSFGDPAMKLALPKPSINLTKMNGIEISKSRDTLKALSKIKFEGIIADQNGQLINDFNGSMSATIYDKPLDKITLDNDQLGKTMEFTAIESKIFSGRASVDNGEFSFEFIVPKDIRIAYGNAKISLYADNIISDRNGSDPSIIIGGLNPDAPSDSQGPEIKLFMNDESFVDGGNTSSSPLLFAILEDTSGINTSITAVDHDIVAILDDDNNNPYILNDYYETELNDFQKGKVKFPFRDLEPGLHTIKLKCWDTYNNPSESTLTFIVVNDNDLILSNVLNYPNPFINYTEFWFNHNKPNETLDVQVQIFTVSGKLIKTLNRSVQSDGLLSREISWNGLDDFGNKIGKGVYVYKLHVRSQISNAKAEKFEKLVILQ
ncbi:MAG: type IX secretion system sortase PorU [Flavobacteriales bacterium]|nr:type IX secretion system sortase PorU [Flavobacteriales bacterium]